MFCFESIDGGLCRSCLCRQPACPSLPSIARRAQGCKQAGCQRRQERRSSPSTLRVLMVDCVVPVSANNSLAYNLVLVLLYLVAKKTSGETQQRL